MNWRRISKLFYIATSIPSSLVGLGLCVHRWLRTNDSVNQANVESYHRRTFRRF
jgi:hypothetical protein